MKIYQVELANYCNLSCEYCPNPKQRRKKGYMSIDTFMDVVSVAKLCEQSLIYLHNFGEPLMHPHIAEFISYASNEGIECSFFTNGLLLSEEVIKSLYEAGLKRISISNHVKNTHLAVIENIEKSTVPLVIDEVYTPTIIHNWVGQVEYKGCNHVCTKSENPCIFQRKDAFVVLWNGDIASCCLDCEGISVKHTIKDLLHSPYSFSGSRLCDCCDLMRGEENL